MLERIELYLAVFGGATLVLLFLFIATGQIQVSFQKLRKVWTTTVSLSDKTRAVILVRSAADAARVKAAIEYQHALSRGGDLSMGDAPFFVLEQDFDFHPAPIAIEQIPSHITVALGD